MTVCIVGSGAREHALALACARTTDVVVTPGNPGIQGRSPEGHRLRSTEEPPEEIEADLVVVGPEVPLVEGLADRLRGLGRPVFGPGADGACLEGSKAFMKKLVEAAGVPTARFAVFDRLDDAVKHLRRGPGPYVVKTDGLAAGKGVLVTDDLDRAERDVAAKLSGEAFGASGRRIVIEEALAGREASLLAVCDGVRAVALPVARDYKRALDHDLGPNTGGMGACSPVPFVSGADLDAAMDRIVLPTLAELRRRGIDYRGVLYAGLMLGEEGPRLVEFNVRFGDPETEVVLPRVEGDFAGLLAAAAAGSVPEVVGCAPLAAVCVVAAAQGYPSKARSGDPIGGLDAAGAVEGVTVLHAGTRLGPDGVLRTAGGRVLAVTAVAPTVDEARERAYAAMGAVKIDGIQYRRDIAVFDNGRRAS
ncbi:MAG TPA: phosphoribosylamine--glycine ligase [Acidimicrobiales bacterium]|nr:phosphoribosylamine--glycine ligase [Acidimicrobiales bacterium]